MRAHLLLLLLLLLPATPIADTGADPTELDDSNWQQLLLDGSDWFVKFYAPWCPACQQAAPTWRQLAARAPAAGFKVAQVDVAANQIVGGLFLVTRLPTVYLVHGGQFWQYDGPKTVDSLLRFVSEAEYNKSQPLAWYRSPTALHMRLLGFLVKAVVSVKELHSHLTEAHGVPPIVAYAVVGVFAVAFGAASVVGLICLCDCLFPPTPPPPEGDEADADAYAEDEGEVEDDEEMEDELRVKHAAGNGVDESSGADGSEVDGGGEGAGSGGGDDDSGGGGGVLRRRREAADSEADAAN